MMPRAAIAVLATFLMLPPATAAWSQSRTQSVQGDITSGLTQAEQQSFDGRLRAAQSDQDRATIIAERDTLIQSRLTQPGVRQIPPSPSEALDDPIMSDVPTPRSERWPTGTLPGGALAPTGTGTGPSPTLGGWGWSQ